MAAMTPAAWLARLEPRLDDRWRRRMGGYDAYFEGDHRIAFATRAYREAFGGLFDALVDNWIPLVVESTAERLVVQGFRFGKEVNADMAAWDIWQANDLDSESSMAQIEAIKLGESYWLVTPPPPGSSDPPTITAEHPSQVIVACAPGDRRQRLAALKKWVDPDDGFAYATVYLPEGIANYRSQAPLRTVGGMTGGRINWMHQLDTSGPHDLGEVPMIPIRNAPSMLAGGQSDVKVAMPIQDGLNKLMCDMLLTSEYQAFPQRVMMGLEVPLDPVTHQPTRAAELQAAQRRLWTIPSTEGKVAEFSAADLSNYVNARQHLVRGLTAKTRTPPHYVLGEIVNASGDSLKAAETGLVAKTRRKMPGLEQGHEPMIRLAFKALGDDRRAQVSDVETIWRDPEARTLGELVDAAVKLKGLGIPNRVLWEKIGYSQTEIARIEAMNLADELANPTPTITAPPAAPPATNGNQATPATSPGLPSPAGNRATPAAP